MADEVQEMEEELQKKPKTMLFVIIGVVVLVVVGVVVVVLMTGGDSAEAEAAPAEVVDPKGGPGPLVTLSDFVVNIRAEEGTRFLKTKIVVELVSDTVTDRFDKSRMIVRNEVLMYLSSLEEEKTQTVKQKRAIESHLRKTVNKRLKAKLIKGVFFTEFVTQ